MSRRRNKQDNHQEQSGVMGELAIEMSERTKRRKHCVMFNGEHMWVVCGEVWGCVIVYRASCVFEIYAVNPSRIKYN
jgi:hypothetical protein